MDASDEERLVARFGGGDLLLFESGPEPSESTGRLAAFNDTIALEAFTLIDHFIIRQGPV